MNNDSSTKQLAELIQSAFWPAIGGLIWFFIGLITGYLAWGKT